MKSVSGLIFLFLVPLLGACGADGTVDRVATWQVDFIDDFDTFNTDNWQDQLLWVNDEDQCYLPDGELNTREVSDGTLNSGEGNSLSKQLAAARKKIDNGQCSVAISILNAFITHVGDFVDAGKLSAAEGQSLIDQANILIAQCSAP